MKLLKSTKKDVEKDKDGENVPKLESVEVVLVHCNIVNNNYQQASEVLLTFVANEQYGQLINIAPHSLIMRNTTNSEFPSIEVWFTNQNSEFEISVNYWVGIVKMRYSTEPKFRKYVKGHSFLSFAKKIGDKHGKKLMDTATKVRLHAAKTASEQVVQKFSEATGDLIENKIADKITSLSKTKSKEKEKERQEIYIPPEKRQQIIDDLRFFLTPYKNIIPKNHKLIRYNA